MYPWQVYNSHLCEITRVVVERECVSVWAEDARLCFRWKIDTCILTRNFVLSGNM